MRETLCRNQADNKEPTVCIVTDTKPIGPTTWMAVLRIRNFGYRDNGTMTYRRKVRSLTLTWAQRMRATRRPWSQHWLDRPANPPPGSYEHARVAHIEMERRALRRPVH
jgi:hypothetical protein